MINRIISLSCICFLPFSAWAIFAQNEMKSRMLADLEVIQSTFVTQYAPTNWKRKSIGWELDLAIQQAKDEINRSSSLSVKEYQTILKAFFNSMQDYHVSPTFYSTESASLPFMIKSAEGHYYFTQVERAELPPNAAALKQGDELVSFNGEPIATAVKKFQEAEFNQGRTLTDQAYAELFFTLRRGANGMQVPKGPVKIGVKPKGANKVVNYTLEWKYEPELIQQPRLAKAAALHNMVAEDRRSLLTSLQLPLNQNALFHKAMLSPAYKAMRFFPKTFAADSLGGRESFVPTLGKIVWESTQAKQFHAYIFETLDHHRYGYIRIPHYIGHEEEIAEFRELMITMENETESLVVDQLNNPGGSLFYMYSLASMLTDKPLLVPKHRVSLTQKEIAFALEAIPLFETLQSDEDALELMGETFDGTPVTLLMSKQMLAYFRTVLNEWNSGRTLTKPLHLWGIDKIMPDPTIHYTKPLVVLINSLDVSCADFFPAILQDNKAATLFGAPTAGAGGFVLMNEYPNLLGMEGFSYTGSIAERIDRNPIENVGITPDISYQLKKEDLTQNYSSYVRELLKVLQK